MYVAESGRRYRPVVEMPFVLSFNLRSGVNFFLVSLLLWIEREKNNA